jgi:two-component system NtrC family sensor kinase
MREEQMVTSLKTRMTIVVSLLITALLSVMASVSLSFFESEYKEIISRYQFSVATEMANTIDGKIRDTTSALTLLASYITPRVLSDQKSIRNFFTKHRYSVQLFDNGLFILSPSGRMLDGSMVDNKLKGKDFSFRDYFKKTVATGKPVISEPILSTQATGHPIIVFTAPVFNKTGKLEGVLCGSLDLLKDNFLGRLAEIKLGNKGYLYLFNKSGTLIVHHDQSRILKQGFPPGKNHLFDQALEGLEGTGETASSQGLDTLSCFKKIDSTGWLLATNIPEEEAYSPIYNAKSYLYYLLAVVLIFSVIVVRLFMEAMTSPLIHFSERVREMTGPEMEPSPIEVGKLVSKEIATLGQAFNSLLAEMARRKQVERSQLVFLNTLLDTMPNPVYFKDRDGKYLGSNRAFEDMLGIKRADFVGKGAFDILPRDQAELHARMEGRIIQFNESQVYESRLTVADGTQHDVLFYKAAYPGPDGTPDGVIGTIVDISERRQAEFELAEHAEFAVNLIQNSTVPTFVIDRNHVVIMWNRACEELTGVKAFNAVGANDIGKFFYGYKRPVLADFIIDGNISDLPDIYQNFTRSPLIPKGVRAERWFPDLNGRERYISFTAAPIENSLGELIAVIETFEDNTAQKLAMEQLQESEARIRGILDTAVDGILTIDELGMVISSNRSNESMFGYEQGSLAGKDVSLLLPLLRLNGMVWSLDRPMGEEGSVSSRFETVGVRQDGTQFPVQIALGRMQLGSRRLLTGVISDITVRKCAEAEIQATMSLLGATLESTADGILVVDISGRIVRSNRKFREMWNIPEELLGRGDDREVTDYVKSQLANPNAFLARIGELYSEPDRGSYDVLEFRDGKIFERISSPQRVGEEITGRVWSFRDVTEQRKLEAQLRHSQKMEAIGTLAGGVAHDFNNMLTAIIGFSILVKQELDASDPKMMYIEQVLAAAERATGLTQSLLSYSRKEPLNPGRHDLNGIVRKVVKLLARLIGEDIELVVSLQDVELAIKADSGQMEQVLMNLATNARDAIPGKGRVAITTGLVELSKDFVRAHGFGKAGRYVNISFADTGEGMDRRTMERIFEPFYTTKQIGRGTGLGLSMVYGIIKQHDGFISVNSELGLGTTFDIYLPMAASPEEKKTNVEEEVVVGGTETILIVEDSPEIRELLVQVLSGAGYRSLEAVDGQDGVDRFRENLDDVQLVILDVIMPRKNGKEAFEEIRSMKGEVKAIFTSGYTGDIISRQGILAGEYNFIAKPLSPNKVLAKVREVLDGRIDSNIRTS